MKTEGQFHVQIQEPLSKDQFKFKLKHSQTIK